MTPNWTPDRPTKPGEYWLMPPDRCDPLPAPSPASFMNYGRDKVLRLHEKVQKEPK